MSEPDQIQPPVAIVVSRYNASITDALREGAVAAYREAGGRAEDLTVVEAPGAFELPAVCAAAARSGRHRGVVAIGCLIQGETTHADHIAAAVTQGLVRIAIDTGVPVTFGVLTVQTPEQARERAGGSRGNKGAEAMHALLETIASADAVGSDNPPRARARAPQPDKAAPAAGA